MYPETALSETTLCDLSSDQAPGSTPDRLDMTTHKIIPDAGPSRCDLLR